MIRSSKSRNMSTLLLLSLGLSGSVVAAPVGELLPLTEMAEAIYAMNGKSIEDLRQTIPSLEDVSFPVYPDVFYTAQFRGEGMLPSVILASPDPIEKVKTWYASQDGLSWNEMFEVFHVGDSYQMMATECVMLQDISADPSASTGGMAGFDMAGMKTQITVSYRNNGQ